MRPLFLTLCLGLSIATASHAPAATDSLFHGSKVNTATVDASDPYWQTAYREETRAVPVYNGHGIPLRIDRGDPFGKQIALTFDDGPHPRTLPKLLSLLDELDVHATFFVVGKMVERDPALARMIVAHGHEIGNHTFSHVNLSRVDETTMRTEYEANQDLLRNVVGFAPRYCRPPGGQATPQVFRAACAEGLESVMWTDDPGDYKNPGVDTIVSRTLSHASHGGIILLHEGVDETLQALPIIVESLRAKGYRFVTIDELASTGSRAFGRVHLHSRNTVR